VAEAGYDGVKAEFYIGVAAPAKTPAPKISRLIRWFTTALGAPQIKATFAALGFFSGGQCGADFSAILHKELQEIRPGRSRSTLANELNRCLFG
jgi:tripartite-type tricarboxylate transporter receptor subunit TctC